MLESLKKNFAWVLISVIFSLSLIFSTAVAMDGLNKIKGVNTITVTGSAKKSIVSDYVVWKGSFKVTDPSLTVAYTSLSDAHSKVKAYLNKKNIEDKDIIFSSINTNYNYKYTSNGAFTNIIDTYNLEQNIEIRSTDIQGITKLSRESTDLINEGVQFTSLQPSYYYTKIADLKIDMLAEATKDAKSRASKIAKNTDSSIGNLKSAKMGVFQITPALSTEISDSGINDTTSIEKEITAVITCSFEVR